MKKKVSVIVICCMACSMGVFLSLNSEEKMSDLLLANVEALAFMEGYVPVDCAGYGSVDCPGTQVKVEYVATGWTLENLH